MSLKEIEYEPLLPIEFTRPLQTIDICIASVEPKKTNDILKILSSKLSMVDMNIGHLKRIKKSEKHEKLLDVIINTSADVSKTEKDIKELFKNNNINEDAIKDFRLCQASKYPAYTKSQFNEWKNVWPMIFKDHDSQHNLKLSEEDLEKAKKWLNIALEKAEKDKSEVPNNQFNNCTIIVDPSTSKVLAIETDNRIKCNHPLKHSVMECIKTISELHTKKDNLDSENENEQSNKRRKLNTEIDSSQPYLCTNYDLYTIKEPCIMCCMALVHSRIGRVFYLKKNENDGGLESIHQIHIQPELNHHFQVYKIKVKQ
ncbi:cytidine deaminase-like protein [Anaeromyces robustus]|uniref:Cytidine deaminase-like protein n=1 Tax=Anaeromyces robustus TaxID=1754192 RepID=A0A1Y1WR22_9FUNG|nr:cytidine deaminase-like protein [Anaeromyces robustus]|eukprot:ORX75574.1 cytidine deaminase-like protein [Anaeromyces robustus]